MTTNIITKAGAHDLTREVSNRLGSFKALPAVPLPVQRKLVQQMDILRLTSAAKEPGSPTDGMCISLPSGVGKTTAALMLRKSAAKRAGKTEDDGPVLIVTLDVEDTIPLWSSILRDLNDPYYYAGTPRNLKRRALKFLAARGIQLIIIDEFNHCVDRGQARFLMNTVKEILNAGAAPVVVMGTDEEVARLPKMQAFERRMVHAPEIGPLDWDDAEHAESWQGFLQGLDKGIVQSCGWRAPSKIGTARVAKAMCEACDGIVGYAHWVVFDALTEVLMRGGTTIETRDLAMSVNRLFVKFDMFDRVNAVDALV